MNKQSQHEKTDSGKLVLVTGATGYIGGRLIGRLLGAGYQVRVLVRGNVERLSGRPWRDRVDVVQGDVLKPESLEEKLAGIDVAYYLIHSMRSHEAFSERDIQAARNFGSAAAVARAKRIIYLGGLGDPQSDLSEHLRSRQQTGLALREFGIPVTEFRAGTVIGSGSLSFELVRDLTERLPVMICPKWVFTTTHPISISDVLSYLQQALEVPASADKTIEIGGSDNLTYADMMMVYARIRGLRRMIIPVPVLTPSLSSYWVHWMTPIPANIARPLIEGLRNEIVADSRLAGELFPEIKPMGYEAAVRLALERAEEGDIETIWSDAMASSKADASPGMLTHEQGMFIERRRQIVAASPDVVFQVFTSLGGDRGWPPFTWLWRLRGALDRLAGGVGMRRGRRHPDRLRVGEALDFWRVESVVPDKLLRLRAEMKLPGRGWLQFEVKPESNGNTELIQTAFFASRGLFGLLYWYMLYPAHGLVFGRMIKLIARTAEASSAARLTSS